MKSRIPRHWQLQLKRRSLFHFVFHNRTKNESIMTNPVLLKQTFISLYHITLKCIHTQLNKVQCTFWSNVLLAAEAMPNVLFPSGGFVWWMNMYCECVHLLFILCNSVVLCNCSGCAEQCPPQKNSPLSQNWNLHHPVLMSMTLLNSLQKPTSFSQWKSPFHQVGFINYSLSTLCARGRKHLSVSIATSFHPGILLQGVSIHLIQGPTLINIVLLFYRLQC